MRLNTKTLFSLSHQRSHAAHATATTRHKAQFIHHTHSNINLIHFPLRVPITRTSTKRVVRVIPRPRHHQETQDAVHPHCTVRHPPYPLQLRVPAARFSKLPFHKINSSNDTPSTPPPRDTRRNLSTIHVQTSTLSTSS